MSERIPSGESDPASCAECRGRGFIHGRTSPAKTCRGCLGTGKVFMPRRDVAIEPAHVHSFEPILLRAVGVNLVGCECGAEMPEAEWLAIRESIATPDAEEPGVYCDDCGREYGDEHGFPDLVVPHDAWATISPTGDEGGLLCPSCLCKRAHDAGLQNIAARLADAQRKVERVRDTCRKVLQRRAKLSAAARESRPASGGRDPANEVCAKCGFLFKNHEGNTGCLFPCWTSSGRYSDTNEATRTPAIPPTVERETLL